YAYPMLRDLLDRKGYAYLMLRDLLDRKGYAYLMLRDLLDRKGKSEPSGIKEGNIGIRAIGYREVVLFRPTGYLISEDPEKEPIKEELLEESKEEEIDDLFDQLPGSRYFFKIDLRSGYHQLRLHEADIPKTSSRMRIQGGSRGSFEISFGAAKEGESVAIFSKYDFWSQEVHFLGHVVNSNGIQVDPSKIEAVMNWKDPKIPLEIRNQKYEWGMEQEEAFQTLKENLCNAPILSLPDRTGDFVVHRNESNQGLGCVPMQRGKVIACDHA
ncbi:putative reverse transcriptase domain-containing protein, partial [Tanacetum coccineum]